MPGGQHSPPALPAAAASAALGALPTFMLAMLLSGSMNTLLMKFMVIQEVPAGEGLPPEGFDHPYFQTLLMMIGECLCLLAYYLSTGREELAKAQDVPLGVFGVACSLDWTATTLVNMAYVFIAASVVQMTRGAIVIFTCLFSVLFLGRRQYHYHIAGVTLVFIGITLVSLSALLRSPADSEAFAAQGLSASWAPALGICLCIVAQVFQASMLVYEEKILSQYVVSPLRVVGMEGLCGFLLGIVLLVGLNAGGVESTPRAVYQMSHSPVLFMAVVGSIFSIAIFNFTGVTVTQRASAVSRSTIDVSRTILIWAVELALGWNRFSPLQLVGFVAVAVGTLLYNRLLTLPFLEPPAEAQALGEEDRRRATSYGSKEDGEAAC